MTTDIESAPKAAGRSREEEGKVPRLPELDDAVALVRLVRQARDKSAWSLPRRSSITSSAGGVALAYSATARNMLPVEPLQCRFGEAGMTRTDAKVILVVAVLGLGPLVYGLYGAYSSWMKKGPEPGSRAWQVQEFRKDLKACDAFAGKREQARELLAWKPRPPWVNKPGTAAWEREYEQRREQESAEIHAKLQNLNADLKARSARFQADENACLQSLDWPDEQIQTLRKAVAEPPTNKLLQR